MKTLNTLSSALVALALSSLVLALAGCGGRSVGTGDAAPKRDKSPGVDIALGIDAPVGGCRDNRQCNASQYCHIGGGCVVTGAKLGECRARPKACPELYSPTCGCDGITYGNPCEAQSKGVNVKRAGACEADPLCSNVACAVIDDCCSCRAYQAKGPPPPSCPATCKTNMCEVRAVAAPYGYCAAGKCLLGSNKDLCRNDGDCRKVDSCCACTSVAIGHKEPICPPVPCAATACAALGLTNLRASCENDRCQLVAN